MTQGGLEARILVCDPDNVVFPALPEILHERFGGEVPSKNSIDAVRNFGNFEINGIEYTIVDDMASAVEQVAKTKAPYYSLVVYETNIVKETEGSAGKIADIRKLDFFLPQMIVGKGLSASLAGHCARAGALYFAETSQELNEGVNIIFRRPKNLPNLTIVKIGGSAFDYDRQNKGSFNLEYVCKTLVDIHQSRDAVPQSFLNSNKN